MSEKLNKENFILRLIKILGIACFILAAYFFIIMILMRSETIRTKYGQYLIVLQELENKVAALDNRWLIIIVIFLLYLLRSLSMIYPYTVLYIISAMVFSPWASLTINILGMAIVFAVRYYTGIQMGEGYLNKVLKRYPNINSAFNEKGRTSPLVLFSLRIVPFFPLNTVSQLYGTFEYPFGLYMLLSVTATVPRLLSYSLIGNNVYDPLSTRFSVPLIVLCVFSGCALFFMRAVIGLTFKVNHKAKRLTNKKTKK